MPGKSLAISDPYWLYKEVLCSVLAAVFGDFRTIIRCYNNDWDITEAIILLYEGEQLKAIHFRHVQIEKDQVKFPLIRIVP